MAKRVTAIPATLNRFTSAPVHAAAKRKVAGYARVSTDNEEQQTSYEAQMDYYREYITGRKDWQFVGMYSDEGISATNTRHRDGFNRMIDDALAGKIELIITKSISRFARNTVDSLTTVRKLKEKGVGHVVITMGSRGAYCGDCDRLFPCRKVKAVDCVAAGDTFNGAFVVALAEGRPCAEAIAFAQEASAISVTRPGAQSSVPFRREVGKMRKIRT